MGSKTEICNLAIGHLGTSKTISNLDSKRDKEAILCKQYYDIALRKTLRDFTWSFATDFKKLNLIREQDRNKKGVEWKFVYALPSDCLRVVRVKSGVRIDANYTKVPYKITAGDTNGLLYTDERDAEIEYIKYINTPDLYTPDFIMSFSYLLAYFIAPALMREEGGENQLLQKYEHFVMQAKNLTYNEESPDLNLPSDLEESRYC